MPDFPLLEGQRHELIGATAASAGIAVTSGGANTKSAAWGELIASTAFGANLVVVTLYADLSTVVGDGLVDIAIGAAGSEVIIVADLAFSRTSSGDQSAVYSIPIQVPAGSRLSAKVQHAAASVVTRIGVGLHGSGMISPSPLQRVTTYGANAADSGGVNIDPGGVANTLVWTQIVAATTYEHAAFLIGIQLAANGTRTANSHWIGYLGIGAGGAEQTIGTFHLTQEDGSDTFVPGSTHLIPASVPSGTRLAVGASCNIIDAADRLFDAIVYGVS